MIEPGNPGNDRQLHACASEQEIRELLVEARAIAANEEQMAYATEPANDEHGDRHRDPDTAPGDGAHDEYDPMP
jgi:hypothetical protein